MKVKTLLIDLGNTALNWALLGDERTPHTVVHRGQSGFKERLYSDWLELAPDRVIGCTVAAPELAFSATKFFNDHDISWNWVRSQNAFVSDDLTLRNAYSAPGKLGADRWCAALGAIDAAPGQSLLVVQMGTATTVDAVLCEAEGQYAFLGGRIAPGPTMMKKCLEDGIPLLQGELGEWRDFPQNTRNAIATGIMDAQAGLVRLGYEELVKRSGTARVVLAGGAARFIEPRLRGLVPDLMLQHNLVLLGLAAQARHRPRKADML